MNVTTFKEKVSALNLNEVERYRIKYLLSKSFKNNVRWLGFIEVTDDNLKEVWNKLNKLLADQDKFHRIQTHKMRNSKRRYVDYGHLAYNEVTEDF